MAYAIPDELSEAVVRPLGHRNGGNTVQQHVKATEQPSLPIYDRSNRRRSTNVTYYELAAIIQYDTQYSIVMIAAVAPRYSTVKTSPMTELRNWVRNHSLAPQG